MDEQKEKKEEHKDNKKERKNETVSNNKKEKNKGNEIKDEPKKQKEKKQENNDTSKKEENKQEIKKEDRKHKTSKRVIIVILSVIIILLVLSTIFAILNMNNQNIVFGVQIEGIEVQGLSKEIAVEKMKSIYNTKIEKEIGVEYQDYKNTVNPTLLEVNYNIEKAVDEACKVGKTDNLFVNNYQILLSMILKNNIKVEMNLNEDILKQTISDLGTNLPGIIIESSYSVEDDKLYITKGKEGIIIDTDKMSELIKEKLNDINAKEDYIQIAVLKKKPDAIDIQKIHDEIYKEASDAYFTKTPFAIYPEVEGIDFDIEQAKQILSEDKEEYIIPLKITKPKVTLDQIGSEAFSEKLATFTTRYDASNTDRTTNLRIACQKINGKVVLAGETFSYNKVLGPRTEATGYKNGKIYVSGEVVDGIGGGICQISSTLYNAVLMADLEIVERRNHQFVTSYLPAGRDATVAYGVTDFKFKNTRKFPIRIQASVQNGIATVSIYGIKEEQEYTFNFSTKTVASIPYETQYIEDNSIEMGKEVIKQKGVNGLKTETYITKMLNGKVISTKLLSKDTYDSMAQIIIRGTKQGNTAQETQTTTEVIPTETPVNPEKPTEQQTEEKQKEKEEEKKQEETEIQEQE